MYYSMIIYIYIYIYTLRICMYSYAMVTPVAKPQLQKRALSRAEPSVSAMTAHDC